MTKKYRISGESFEKSYFGSGYYGLGDCYYNQGLECLKCTQYSVLSFFRDRYLFYGYIL